MGCGEQHSHDYITTLMALCNLAMCLFVLPCALRCKDDGDSRVGLPEKGSYTVHFAPALISMSASDASNEPFRGGWERRRTGAEPVKAVPSNSH